MSTYLNFTIPSILTFSYYIKVAQNNAGVSLKVSLLQPDASDRVLLYTATGDPINYWKNATICLPVGPYRVIFECSDGGSVKSEVIVDNVTVVASTTTCSFLMEPAAYGKHAEQSGKLLNGAFRVTRMFNTQRR